MDEPDPVHALTETTDFADADAEPKIEIDHDEQAALAMELAPPPVFTEQGGVKYEGSEVHGSDSGLGTEPPTATEERPHGEAAEYFAMTAADGVGVGS